MQAKSKVTVYSQHTDWENLLSYAKFKGRLSIRLNLTYRAIQAWWEKGGESGSSAEMIPCAKKLTDGETDSTASLI